MTGAAELAAALANAGVTHVFGTPGESTLPWYSATQNSELTHVMARCERCAGYMADVYGRLTNRVAVCDAPGGIGSPHLLPALHESHNSSTPMIVLTSATPESKRGTWATSECEHTDIFRPTVKAVVEIRTAARLSELAQRSVDIAVVGRPGPVHLDVGADVLDGEVSGLAKPESSRYAALLPGQRPRPARDQVIECADLIVGAKRPLLIAGGGTQLSAADDAVTRIVSAFDIPCATTFNGKGSIAESAQHAVGVIGAKGSVAANALAERADLIVWLGSKGGDKSTNYRQIPSQNAKSIQVDIDPQELNNSLSPTIAVNADIRSFLSDLGHELSRRGWSCPSDWQTQADTEGTQWPTLRYSDDLMSIAGAIAWINSETPESTVIVADASRACSWIGGLFRTRRSGRSVIAPRGSGSIGYSLPGAIAACVARPDDLVIGIGGDGGLGMSVHEMETARRIGVSPIFILLNDGAFGLLNEVASVTMDQPTLIDRFAHTDWPQIARGFGWKSTEATTTVELINALQGAIISSAGGMPTLIDARITSAEPSPDVSLFRSRRGSTT